MQVFERERADCEYDLERLKEMQRQFDNLPLEIKGVE